jgi:hypothetical protein
MNRTHTRQVLGQPAPCEWQDQHQLQYEQAVLDGDRGAQYDAQRDARSQPIARLEEPEGRAQRREQPQQFREVVVDVSDGEQCEGAGQQRKRGDGQCTPEAGQAQLPCNQNQQGDGEGRCRYRDVHQDPASRSLVGKRTKASRDPREQRIEAPRPGEPTALRDVNAGIELDHRGVEQDRIQDAAGVIEGIGVRRYVMAVDVRAGRHAERGKYQQSRAVYPQQ